MKTAYVVLLVAAGVGVTVLVVRSRRSASASDAGADDDAPPAPPPASGNALTSTLDGLLGLGVKYGLVPKPEERAAVKRVEQATGERGGLPYRDDKIDPTSAPVPRPARPKVYAYGSQQRQKASLSR